MTGRCAEDRRAIRRAEAAVARLRGLFGRTGGGSVGRLHRVKEAGKGEGRQGRKGRGERRAAARKREMETSAEAETENEDKVGEEGTMEARA